MGGEMEVFCGGAWSHVYKHVHGKILRRESIGAGKVEGGGCLLSTGGFEQFDAFSPFSLHEFFERGLIVRIFTLHGFVERCLPVVIRLVNVNTGNCEQ